MAISIFVKLLTSTLLFVSLLSKGNGQCFPNNIIISQQRTGFQIHGMTQWRATVSNDCLCTQLNVKLDCTGFQTTESIDPSILAVSGSECLVNNGSPIFRSKPITFTYAWDPSFQFKPLSSQVACS